jgi:predicted Zn-dependent protease
MKIKGSGDSETDSVTQGLAFLVGGNSQSARAAFSQAIDKGLDLIFKNGYKKTDELQSDRDATLNTALVGYSPSGLAKYLARIREVTGEDKDTTNSSGDDRTHPTFASRIVQINGLVKSNGIDANDLEINQARFSQATKSIK